MSWRAEELHGEHSVQVLIHLAEWIWTIRSNSYGFKPYMAPFKINAKLTQQI